LNLVHVSWYFHWVFSTKERRPLIMALAGKAGKALAISGWHGPREQNESSEAFEFDPVAWEAKRLD